MRQLSTSTHCGCLFFCQVANTALSWSTCIQRHFPRISMKFRPTPTIANNVYAVTLVLLLLMGLITVVGTTMSLRVGSMVSTISETYLPVYRMLARTHI